VHAYPQRIRGTPVVTVKPRRRKAALGTVCAVAALVAAATPQAAMADTMRTLSVPVGCASGIVPFGLSVNNGSGWYYPTGSSYSVGATKYFTVSIPSTATSLALDTFCYYSTQEYNGQVSYPDGTWEGYTYAITAGTSTINTTASCVREPVYPGPWVRYCSLSAITYS
jgi:hypothetical protein